MWGIYNFNDVQQLLPKSKIQKESFTQFTQNGFVWEKYFCLFLIWISDIEDAEFFG